MGKRTAAVDIYIAKSPEFAKPILTQLRWLAHRACPDVEETLKWRMPHFLHKGILFGMAAFKQHCAIHFWKGKLVMGENTRTGQFGNLGRVTTLSDLPNQKALLAYIKKAVELNETGVQKPKPLTVKKKLTIPTDFAAALRKNKKAQAAFENFSYSHKKEYLEWITEAKREETRQKRIETTLQWLTEGKSRNWKYISR